MDHKQLEIRLDYKALLEELRTAARSADASALRRVREAEREIALMELAAPMLGDGPMPRRLTAEEIEQIPVSPGRLIVEDRSVRRSWDRAGKRWELTREKRTAGHRAWERLAVAAVDVVAVVAPDVRHDVVVDGETVLSTPSEACARSAWKRWCGSGTSVRVSVEEVVSGSHSETVCCWTADGMFLDRTAEHLSEVKGLVAELSMSPPGRASIQVVDDAIIFSTRSLVGKETAAGDRIEASTIAPAALRARWARLNEEDSSHCNQRC